MFKALMSPLISLPYHGKSNNKQKKGRKMNYFKFNIISLFFLFLFIGLSSCSKKSDPITSPSYSATYLHKTVSGNILQYDSLKNITRLDLPGSFIPISSTFMYGMPEIIRKLPDSIQYLNESQAKLYFDSSFQVSLSLQSPDYALIVPVSDTVNLMNLFSFGIYSKQKLMSEHFYGTSYTSTVSEATIVHGYMDSLRTDSLTNYLSMSFNKLKVITVDIMYK